MSEKKTKLASAGIDIERLVNKEANKNFEELMKCKICFKVLVNPHDCEVCGNTFCYDCINNLKLNKKPCPFNCLYYTLKPSSLGITSFLSGLKFHCLNKNNGCAEQIPHLQVLTHDKECKYSTASCPNVSCNKVIKRQLLEYHINKECEFSLFKCDNCDLDFNRNDYVEHIENCKVVSNLFLNKKAIINSNDHYEDIELKDVSLKGFMKMIFYHLSKSKVEVEQKFAEIQSDVKGIKEDVNRYINENMLFAESINNELEMINEKLSSGDQSTDMIKKMVEENFRQTIVASEVKSQTSVNTSNSSSINFQHKQNSNSSTENLKSSLPITNKNSDSGGVKKVTIRNLNKGNASGVTTTLNKSPTQKNITTKSPPKKTSPMHSNNSIKGSPKSKTTYKTETENYHNRTNNIVLLKTMIRNQDSIMHMLNSILQRIDTEENNLVQCNQELKKFLSAEIIDEIKSNTMELSYMHSSMIIKKLDDIYSNK